MPIVHRIEVSCPDCPFLVSYPNQQDAELFAQRHKAETEHTVTITNSRTYT